MLRLHSVERAGEFFEGGFGIAKAEIARLLEGGERLRDAGNGELVWGDVKVGDGVADELRGVLARPFSSSFSFFLGGNGYERWRGLLRGAF